jgi:hypothetical protein
VSAFTFFVSKKIANERTKEKQNTMAAPIKNKGLEMIGWNTSLNRFIEASKKNRLYFMCE